MKRVLDFLVAAVAFVMLFPVILVVALLIRLYLGKPVLFCQRRPGFHEKSINVYKFRTMALLYDTDGTLLSDSERMTKLGTFLRNYSLDELPQLFNVLKGDLSLVGPRPLLIEYLPLYSEEQSRRHQVRPGITGWAQVNGRNAISWEEKFKYDVWYVDHQSFGLDLKILWMTLKKVISSEGISQKGNVTMEKFQGNSNHVQGEQ